jgi:hypothetical protein
MKCKECGQEKPECEHPSQKVVLVYDECFQLHLRCDSCGRDFCPRCHAKAMEMKEKGDATDV